MCILNSPMSVPVFPRPVSALLRRRTTNSEPPLSHTAVHHPNQTESSCSPHCRPPPRPNRADTKDCEHTHPKPQTPPQNPPLTTKSNTPSAKSPDSFRCAAITRAPWRGLCKCPWLSTRLACSFLYGLFMFHLVDGNHLGLRFRNAGVRESQPVAARRRLLEASGVPPHAPE